MQPTIMLLLLQSATDWGAWIPRALPWADISMPLRGDPSNPMRIKTHPLPRMCRRHIISITPHMEFHVWGFLCPLKSVSETHYLATRPSSGYHHKTHFHQSRRDVNTSKKWSRLPVAICDSEAENEQTPHKQLRHVGYAHPLSYPAFRRNATMTPKPSSVHESQASVYLDW